ncbi:MAG TPA: hypothetical protein VF487_02745 [Chitinophagaceae bacterium]
MKKIMILLAVMLACAINMLASAEEPDQQIINAFKKEFAAAQDVTWSLANKYYRADFEFNGERVFAFYRSNGELYCVGRYILSTQLPYYLQKNLKKEYADYWITDLFEISGENGTKYYVALKKGDNNIILESGDNINWELFHKYKND